MPKCHPKVAVNKDGGLYRLPDKETSRLPSPKWIDPWETESCCESLESCLTSAEGDRHAISYQAGVGPKPTSTLAQAKEELTVMWGGIKEVYKGVMQAVSKGKRGDYPKGPNRKFRRKHY